MGGRIDWNTQNVAKSEPSPTTEEVRFASWVVPPGPVSAREMRRLATGQTVRPEVVLFILSVVALFGTLASGSLISFCLTIGLGLAALWSYGRAKIAVTEEEWEEFQTNSPEGSWLVEINILQQGTVTGQDRGVLWCEEGKLNFNGVYTSFALTAADFLVVGSIKKLIIGHTRQITYALNQPTRDDLWLSIDPIARGGVQYPRSNSQIAEEIIAELYSYFNRWPSNSPGQLPPLDDGPMRPHILSLFGLVLYSVCSATLISLVVAAVLAILCNPPSIVLWGSALLCFVTSSFFTRVRALYSRIRRDLRQRGPHPRAIG